MLTDQQQFFVQRQAWLYDHSWRYHAAMFGESYLLAENYLAYHDGELLSICLFPLDQKRKVSIQEVLRAAKHEVPTAQAVFLWGGLDVPYPDAIHFSESLSLVSTSTFEKPCIDVAIDLTPDYWEKHSAARKACRRSCRENFELQVDDQNKLTPDHIKLIRDFVATHPEGSEYSKVLPAYLSSSQNEAWLLNAYKDGKLAGFYVIMNAGPDFVIAAQHYRNHAFHWVSDAIYSGLVNYCLSQKVRKLSLGYSFSQSLWDYKKKWGATVHGPVWKTALYAKDPVWRKHSQEGYLNWRDRRGESWPVFGKRPQPSPL